MWLLDQGYSNKSVPNQLLIISGVLDGNVRLRATVAACQLYNYQIDSTMAMRWGYDSGAFPAKSFPLPSYGFSLIALPPR